MTRIFVTATPENVVYKYSIRHVISLEIPLEYQGFEAIRYEPLRKENIPAILRRDIAEKRRIAENGIILYNIERVREGRGKKKELGQDIALANVIEHCPDVVCSVYNGNGITVYLPPEYRSFFEVQLKQYNLHKKSQLLKYTVIETDEHIDHLFQVKNISIGWFYQFCKNIDIDIVITIGCDLMNRGISFCSIKKETNVLAATTMIYAPNPQRHGVGLVQTIGRICGTSRPDLPRVLYAPEPIIQKYKAMCENQKHYIPNLQSGLNRDKHMDSEKFFQGFPLPNRYPGLTDRPNVGLTVQFEKSKEASTDDGCIDGVELSQLRKLCNGRYIVSKMLRYLMDQNEPINIQELKNGIESRSTDKAFIGQIKNGCGPGAQFGMLWNSKNNHQEILMNPNIRKYILQNNL